MATVGFIGVGNMGGPMARNLVKAQHSVQAFDLVAANVAAVVEAGGNGVACVADAVKEADVVVTMLPAGRQVRQVYFSEGGIFESAKYGALLIDCSTIDVDTARHVANGARINGYDMVDAPVSGGVGGAEAGTLTMMVGGSDEAFARAKPILERMGRNIVHCGGPGNGQAAKICNNMILGISMVAVSEAFCLADKLGLDRQKLFDVSSTASGQCWALTSYCPVPGPVPASPANRDYKAGFTTDMMVKDLRLAQEAAHSAGVGTTLGAAAQALYGMFAARGQGAVDFSAIIRMIRGEV